MVHQPDDELGSGPGGERRWVPVAVAARALGITEHAVRRRIKRSTIETRRETVGNHVRTLVAIPVANGVDHAVENLVHDGVVNGVSTGVANAGLLARAVAAEAVTDELRARLEALERRLDEAYTERDRLLTLVERLTAERSQPATRRAWWRRWFRRQ